MSIVQQLRQATRVRRGTLFLIADAKDDVLLDVAQSGSLGVSFAFDRDE